MIHKAVDNSRRTFLSYVLKLRVWDPALRPWKL